MGRLTKKQLSLIQNSFFDDESLQRDPARYVFIGFIAADGCIAHPYSGRKEQKRIVFNLCKKDKCVLDIFNKYLAKKSRPIHNQDHTNSFIMAIPSDKLTESLSKFGIVPRKTKTLELPNLPEPAMSYFLRGYYYGDGWIYGDRGRRRYGFCSNRIFINQLHDYLISNKIVKKAGIYNSKNSKYCAALEIQASNTVHMSKYLFQDDKYNLLPRKHIKTEPWLYRGKMYGI